MLSISISGLLNYSKSNAAKQNQTFRHAQKRCLFLPIKKVGRELLRTRRFAAQLDLPVSSWLANEAIESNSGTWHLLDFV